MGSQRIVGKSYAQAERMIPKSGNRFSDKIMRKQTVADLKV
jgi:hypothetical protein